MDYNMTTGLSHAKYAMYDDDVASFWSNVVLSINEHEEAWIPQKGLTIDQVSNDDEKLNTDGAIKQCQ